MIARLRQRLYQRTVLSGKCLLWTGGLFKDGYGKITVRASLSPTGRTYYARTHRVAWFLHTSKWPPNDLCVLHKCDVRRCIRFDHLWLGTKKDNAEDAVEKGRWHSGPRNPENTNTAKLTWEKVREIRSLRAIMTQQEMADLYEVHQTTISGILSGRLWKE